MAAILSRGGGGGWDKFTILHTFPPSTVIDVDTNIEYTVDIYRQHSLSHYRPRLYD